jgi:hypothetical protein
MKNRFRFRHLLIGFFVAVVTAIDYLRITAAPVHRFDPTWFAQRGPLISSDARIKHMVKRAKIDYFVSPVPEVGRRFIAFDSARSAGSDGFDVVLFPGSISDTLIVYRFSRDGKMLWKEVEWTED